MALFDGHLRECIIVDESIAVFATFVPSFYKSDDKEEYERDNNVLSFNDLFAVSNEEEHEDLIEFTRISEEKKNKLFNTHP